MSEAADKPGLYEIFHVVEQKRLGAEVADEFNEAHTGKARNTRDIACLVALEAMLLIMSEHEDEFRQLFKLAKGRPEAFRKLVSGLRSAA